MAKLQLVIENVLNKKRQNVKSPSCSLVNISTPVFTIDWKTKRLVFLKIHLYFDNSIQSVLHEIIMIQRTMMLIVDKIVVVQFYSKKCFAILSPSVILYSICVHLDIFGTASPG